MVATTPILVAVARSNQPETFFVLALALTAWAATKALARRSLGWLVLAGVFIAAGFQTYMLESWAVWPALAAAYLCTRQSWPRRLAHVAIAGATSLVLSLGWIIVVAFIPASQRPYIGSTLSNSPWEMVFGYNGLGRFGSSTADGDAYRSFTPPFSGSPSVVRLLNEALAAQIGWLVPVALVAIAILIALRFRLPLTVFGTVWFATFAAMFSIVAGMHQFYTAALAIPLALLIGTAFAAARRSGALWAHLALPIAAALSALGISIGLALGAGGTAYSLPAAIVQCVVAAVSTALVVRERRSGRRMPVTTVLGVVALLLTPAVWSAVTIATPNSTNPVAGGVSAMGVGGARGMAVMGGPGAGGAAGFGGAQGPGGAAGSPGGAGGGAGAQARGGHGTGTARGDGLSAEDTAGGTAGGAGGIGGTGAAGGLGTPGVMGAAARTSSGTANTLAWLQAHRVDGTR